MDGRFFLRSTYDQGLIRLAGGVVVFVTALLQQACRSGSGEEGIRRRVG
jgi:hypothetical protein